MRITQAFNAIQSKIAHYADKIDDRILKHRFYFVCKFITLVLWANVECQCDYCSKFKEKDEI